MNRVITAISVIALPFIGYAITRLVVASMPMDESLYVMLAGTLVATIMLTIPYFMLKGIFHEAHLRDPNEEELHLRDLPKDAEKYHDARQESYARDVNDDILNR